METEANKMAKQPSYRFAGYTEAWEQKKLGEIVSWLKGSKLSKASISLINTQHQTIEKKLSRP